MKDEDNLGIRKWIKDSIKSHKHKNQRKKDIKIITGGFINFFTGLYGLISTLFKVSITLFRKNILKKNDDKYKISLSELGDMSLKFISGALVITTLPILIVRFLFRCLVSCTAFTASVFDNIGLRQILSEAKDNDDNFNNEIVRKLEQKSAKYMLNNQDDCKVLNEILQNPILTSYQKIKHVKNKISELDEAYEKRRDMYSRTPG